MNDIRDDGANAAPAEPAPARTRTRLRALRMGLATVLGPILGTERKGFFIPYRHAGSLPAVTGPYESLAERFAAVRSEIARHIAAIERFAPALTVLGEGAPPAPRWLQGWFPRLDAAAAYAMVRTHAPRRIVEIGSGHSTRFMARAVADGGIGTTITAIDPQPRATLDGLDVEHIAAPLHDAGMEPFADLASGDILFVDSSHILMPGSDVDVILNRLWPTLPAGALVHFHDIFLPDGYPEAWAWRGYNEQLAVAALIIAGGADILFASHYAVTRMAEELSAAAVSRLPLMTGAIESSLWLAKRDVSGSGAA